MRTLRLTTLTLVVAVSLAGCTGSAQHVSRPDAPSSETPTPAPTISRFPLPTPTPSFEPTIAPSLKAYVSPPVLVSAKITPIRGVMIGDVVSVEVTVRNTSRKPQTLYMWAGPSTGVVWDLLVKPANASVADSCEHDVNGPVCTPTTIEWRPGIGPLETKTFVVKARVADFRCPARGDFYRELWTGVGGPVAKGPNAFKAWMLYENDADDYVYSKGTPPDREWDCEVDYTV